MGNLYITFFLFLFLCGHVRGILNTQNLGNFSLNSARSNSSFAISRAFNIDNYNLNAKIRNVSKDLVTASKRIFNFKLPSFRGNENTCVKLQSPDNSEVVCAGSKFCTVTCNTGFFTQNGSTTFNYTCTNKKWIEEKSGNSVIENCLPKCDSPCLNGGKCVMPNVCQCLPNYYGSSCETAKVLCEAVPPVAAFSYRKCNSENCTVTCMGEKKFPDGSSTVDLICQNGEWLFSNKEWTSMLDCQAICDPQCMNGGKCIDTNTCFCPEEFRGELCQYSVDNCDASKMNFNGNFNCSGDEMNFSCQLSCPNGMIPTGDFQPEYTCLYSQGVFVPANIPQCEIETSVEQQYNSSLVASDSQIASTCMLWGSNLKTLSNKIISFKSGCTFTLIQDELQHLFHIQALFNYGTISKIIIYFNDIQYILSKKDLNKPVFWIANSGQMLSIPSQLTDLKIEIASGNSVAVYLPSTNLYLVWNLQDEVQIDVSAAFSNRTSGLCGNASSKSPIYLQKYISDAVVSSIFDKCNILLEEEEQCSVEDSTAALNICHKLNDDPIFETCRQKVPVTEYLAACKWSYCNCEKANRMDCMCQLFSKFVQHCVQHTPNLKINWRDHLNCSLNCPVDQMYTSCIPVSQATCMLDQVKPTVLEKYCEEGCVCTSGMILHEGECIKQNMCPCMFGGKFYKPKSVIAKDCNKCTCISGKWSCTEVICKAECLIFGDSHYRTFDGKKFDFSGTCSYKLVVTDDVIVEVVNSACNKCKELKTTKFVIIHIGSETITLKQWPKIFVNNKELEELPAVVYKDTYVRKASSLLIQVVLPNGLEVFWDGKNEIQIFANASLFKKTKGLCGSFNNNQQDDFLTPEGDIEKDIIAFANKWKTSEKCESKKDYEENACDVNIQNKEIAEQYCGNLTGPLFAGCHSAIDPTTFYEDCLNDVCGCDENSIFNCFCPILSAYAQECVKVGLVIDWRKTIRACGVSCPFGQKFETCGISCQRTCADISHGEICKSSCTEGCYCPAGYTFDGNDECTQISKCPCIQQGQKYPSGFIEVKNETETWECKNAQWESRKSTREEIEKYSKKISCPSPNMKYVECEPPEPITCRNMHNPPQYSDVTCHSGCICSDGYVLDSISKKCVKPVDCPCHHGGKSYFEGERIREECNNCTCSTGKWKCTNAECASVCSSWGDSHFRTFDGWFYDFQGTCDYVFAKGSLSSSEVFSVYIEIVPCGTGGTSCTKSILLSSGDVNDTETIKLDKDKHFDAEKEYKKFDVISTGLYVIIMFKDLSISLQWDRGTRLRLQVHSKWKNQISGLCGNYNGNTLDDFQTPSGGLVEVVAAVFADSWKLQEHCPFPSRIKDPCTLHPHRKFWSVMKCSYLKDSSVFKQCHSEVPVEDYYNRCVFDSCACDEGGDCDCLCTVFAAYAQECNAKGVPLKWRTQELCPIQCEPGTRYSPCVSACPVKTCGNIHVSESLFKHCSDVSCVEGCEKRKCSGRKVLHNSTSEECISPNDCDCMTFNGTVYQQNEKISGDDCHSCYCSKGKKICIGLPCIMPVLPPGSGTGTPSKVSSSVCVNGWSSWLNISLNYNDVLDKNKIFSNETIPKVNCSFSEIKSIRCQSKSANSKWKNVNCDFGKKIPCRGNCVKFQIKIQCECEQIDDISITTAPSVLIDKCINCTQLCHHYKKELTGNEDCKTPKICALDSLSVSCLAGTFWRDEGTCVSKDACTCMSKNGTLVKPATYIHEDDCSVCQCVHNEYVCTPASCGSTVLTEKPHPDTETVPDEKLSTTTELIITSSIFPSILPLCSSESLIPIDTDAKYNASTSSPGFEASKAKLITSSGKIVQNKHDWTAGTSDVNQYLEIDLLRNQPIYGVMTAGNPSTEEYVKSYKILYSTDGHIYHYALSFGGSELFRGPYDHKIPETQVFEEPVEGRFIKFKPVTWQNSISMLVRILGCVSTTTFSATESSFIGCGEPMGVESGALSSRQITFSSKMDDNFIASDLSLSSSRKWAPFVASNDQWIKFDFLGERIIDGITTKGSATEESWIEAYKIKYSLDDINWNPILDPDKNEKIFLGNIDNANAYSNKFDTPLRTRFLKIYPVKWHVYPALRVEILGCYKPYKELESIASTEGTPFVTKMVNNVCQSVMPDNRTKVCLNETYWNGEDCVKKEFCPCVDGLLHHEVGSTYIQNQCDKCICSLGGKPSCHPAVDDCPPCSDKDLRRVVSDNCTCSCLPCPPGTLLCTSSGTCLNESLWCNGYKECPDDEIGCVYQSVPKLLPPPKFCPEPTCPDGYAPLIIQNAPKFSKNDLLGSLKNKNSFKTLSFNETVYLKSTVNYTRGTKSISKSINKVITNFSSKNITDYIHFQNMQSENLDAITCQDWNCKPIDSVSCTKPSCPVGAKLTTKWTGEKCPIYECITLPITEKECNVDGRLITTFDGLPFKYGICDHILAEDKIYGTWKVRKINKCPDDSNCVSSLIIKHNENIIQMFTNFTLLFNGYNYTVTQLQAIGSKNQSFVVMAVSTKFIIFASLDLKFGVVWGLTGSVKVMVRSSLHGMIDGLCGHFDFNKKNDLRKPDGKIANSIQEFGDSWMYGNETCELKVCPKDVQIKAKEICQVFKSDPFSLCDFTMNVDEWYVVKCIESLCTCATSGTINFDKDCRCPMLQSFAAKCQSLQPGVDLKMWRLKYECPVNCTIPFVYEDCYDRNCEPSCDSLLRKDQCPRIENRCFPGCYCPDGLIRKGDTCIKPAECRDCICSGSGTMLTTFDQVQIPLDGQCISSILLQTTNTEALEADLKIILTQAQCINPYIKNTVCSRGLTVIIDKKEILLYMTNQSFAVMIDNVTLSKLPYTDSQIKISESPGMSISLSVPSSQLDVIFMANNKGFSIQLPSYIYSDKLRGICGSCNQNQTDDIENTSGELADKSDDFLASWSTSRPTGTEKWKCKPSPPISNQPGCADEPPNDSCLLLTNTTIFGKCHPVIDPLPYVERCKNFFCKGISHCQILAEYAEDCQKKGICLPWRNANFCPYQCPSGFEYKACVASCEINCDNVEQYQKGTLSCSKPVMERCVCPQNQVLQNGSCIDTLKCRPCDTFNHYVGDKWMPDNCSICECLKDGSISCQKKECPAQMVCPIGMKAIIDNNTDDFCCLNYVCVNEESQENCNPPVKIECAKNQIIKLDTTPNNCTQYICVCIPQEQCLKIEVDKSVELLPGMVHKEKKEGCCPSIEIICDQSTCPAPVECPQFHQRNLDNKTKSCCPLYKCELPIDSCIHEYHWIADTNGTERERLPSEVYAELKRVNDTWWDGPCRLCICTNDSSKGVCSNIKCGEPPVQKNYVIKPFYHHGDCCPTYKAVACKANNTVHKVNSSWTIENEPCKTMSCFQNLDTGDISLKEIIQTCDESCKPGWTYQEPENTSTECCGSCKQTSCVDADGILHPSVSTWQSKDKCFTYECDNKLNILGYTETCPDVSLCPDEFLYFDNCCTKCKISNGSSLNCAAVSLSLNKTIALISKQVPNHGECVNREEIKGFTQCDGMCNTFPFFDESSSKYSSICHCCVGVEYTSRQIKLTCNDGYTYEEKVDLPSACGCQACGYEQHLAKTFKKLFK